MSDTPLKILLVDDDPNILRTLSLSLKLLDCKVTPASSVAMALQHLTSDDFDLILTDFRMGEKTGVDIIRATKDFQIPPVVVVITAFASIENAVQVTKEGAFDYLPKPFTTAQLEHLLKKVRLVVSLRRENQKLRDQGGSVHEYFTGFTSIASHRLEEFVQKVSPTDSTVLLIGESGTGKSELARAIHEKSKRHSHPFVTVNCTSLAENLFESEIFGHVKGSFTGAFQDKVGKFELANHGTLFLDEIGDISLNGQLKLLRFLQEKVIERVGSNKSIYVDTRIIGATNKNLEKAVKEGTFREDLYYRLNVLECSLVPLRFRKEDIPILIQKFLTKFSSNSATQVKIPDDVLKVLLDYSWPGNIRELSNVIERIVLLSNGKDIDISDLPETVRHKPEKISGELVTLERLERDYIEKVLATESNQERAAHILGITTVTLWRKRKEYGLA
ncbi:MAG: two-component system response regulator [Bacteriovoracaceae bacterium]|nr:two-component system response regulator [Bacteriovoracaceae bacterium]